MKQFISRAGALSLSVALMLAPTSSDALPPLVAMLVKDIIKQTFKDMLLNSLRDQGCKGIALANAISAIDIKGGGGMGSLPKMPAGMAMPSMPAGMAMPNMPAGMAMPNMPAGMAMPGMPAGMAMPGMPAGMAMPGMPGGMAMPGMSADLMAKMMPGGLPPGAMLSPEQSAMLSSMLSSPPLSPKETFDMIDEMAELGLLPKAIQSEMKECMVVLPQTAAPLGMALGMMKPVIPQMRQAKAMMLSATPEEQDEMIAAMTEQFETISDSDRKTALDMLDGGFFPPRVSEAVKAKLAKK